MAQCELQKERVEGDNILCFDITVDEFGAVEVGKRLDYLMEYGRYLPLGQGGVELGHDPLQRTEATVLHHDGEVLALEIRPVEGRHVRTRAILQVLDLEQNLFELVGIFRVQHDALHRHHFSSRLVACPVHVSRIPGERVS